MKMLSEKRKDRVKHALFAHRSSEVFVSKSIIATFKFQQLIYYFKHIIFTILK